MLEKNSILGGRYLVLDPSEFVQENSRMSDRFHYFKRIQERPFARTKLNIGKDLRLGELNRIVIIKSVKYRDCDYENEESILERRKILQAEIDLLNDINSPLLPEPIDYLDVVSKDDRIPYKQKNNKDLRSKEPVLILDYQSGKTLDHMMDKLVRDGRKTGKAREIERRREICRICKSIATFLKVLKNKNYAYQGLNLKHILLLKDNSVRFLGLGSICKTIDNKLDVNHKNFGVTSFGYSAPEINNINLLDWGADYATSESVGAFSLGVILHQLMIGRDIDYKEDIDIIGDYGQLIYPNEKTEGIIMEGVLGYKIHRLISDLCKEDPYERLTDYDEIISRLEGIFDNRRINRTKNIDITPISTINLISVEEEETNKHCIHDNDLLREVVILVQYYFKGTNRVAGSLQANAYVCNSCEGINKYYVDESSYAELQLKLDEVMKDRNEEFEFNVIDTTENIKVIDKIVVNNSDSSMCIKHNTKLLNQRVALNYYINGKYDNSQGKLYLTLPVCKYCRKVHMSKSMINKAKEILKDKLNDKDIYDFNKINIVNTLTKVNKLTMLDKQFNNCIYDLDKLEERYVSISYRDANVTKNLMIKAKQCDNKNCKTYYINQDGLMEINKHVKSYHKKNFEIIGINNTVDSVKVLSEIETKCTNDLLELTNKRVLINWYENNKSSKIIGKLKIDALVCECGETYIKENIYIKLKSIINSKGGYFKVEKIQRPIIDTVRIVSDNISTYEKKYNLKQGIINISYINEAGTQEILEYPNIVTYCEETSEVYLEQNEYDYIVSILGDNCQINKKKNLFDFISNLGNKFGAKK